MLNVDGKEITDPSDILKAGQNVYELSYSETALILTQIK